MTDIEKFCAEVVDLHIEIERWFTGAAHPNDLVHCSNASRLSFA
ncbi:MULTISPECIES: hypothetical protein [unclassified Ensifer]